MISRKDAKNAENNCGVCGSAWGYNENKENTACSENKSSLPAG